MEKKQMDPNLLTLCGANGCGKTRVLQELVRRSDGYSCMRIGAETLVDDIVFGVRSGLEIKNVFERYREIDTLLIDNLWVLAVRPKTSRVIRELVGDRMSDDLFTVLASDMTVDCWLKEQQEMAELISKGQTVSLA